MDFGCGWGEFLVMASFFGTDAYGVDRAQDRRSNAEAVGAKVVSSLEELDPKPKGRFHAVTLFQVLEHVEEPLLLLKTLSEWTMPGGILVLETPNAKNVEGFRSAADYRTINPLSHINAFTPKTLKNIAVRAGFASVAAVPAHATAELLSVARTELRRVIGAMIPPTTGQYFRRSSPPTSALGVR